MNHARTVIAMVGIVILLSAGSSHAKLSPRNPYRSFNSGVNYGAQQWEHAHRCHPHGRLVRR